MTYTSTPLINADWTYDRAQHAWINKITGVKMPISPISQISSTPDQLKTYVVSTDKGDISLDLKTGDITFPLELGRDEAIRDFWFGFQKHFPCGNDEHYERSINILKDELKRQDQSLTKVVKETKEKLVEKIAKKYGSEKFIMIKPEDLIKFIKDDR